MPLKDLVSPRETRVVLRNEPGSDFTDPEVIRLVEQSGMPKLHLSQMGAYQYLGDIGPWRHDERLVRVAMEINGRKANAPHPDHLDAYDTGFDIEIVKGDRYMINHDGGCLYEREGVIDDLSACWVSVDDSTERGLASHCEWIADRAARLPDHAQAIQQAREAAAAFTSLANILDKAKAWRDAHDTAKAEALVD